ncbi:efflux RND transporter periplasmic adaptor subunit [Rhizobium alvei]|uniref:Efflux RND transporter periplasmic adaptor subunit n=1 Tax=Rhizobium alvei TaxID=1132659 RepID=A0ABT8YU28_9HYPH|nr:efflux RND transporter periplasmic adaptor subunit [Rhizobium alvei]MDO6966847.1 efflux RND transporter periplasmic adaptor subunit [Rhizobium alvei]
MNWVRKIGVFTLVVLLAACSQEQQPTGPRAAAKIEVGYIELKSQPVPQTLELRGRVVAFATAEVRPQVNGIVRSIAFAEGREVKAGDILYQIDDATFRATVAAAEAAVKKAEAATVSAKTTYERNKALAETKAVSEQTVEDARSTLLQAQASEEAAKADLEIARIDLGNATIRAPIGGMIGVSSVSVGALVTANQTAALATIRQIDPVYVDLVDTSANFLRIREAFETGRLERKQGVPMSAGLTLENGTPYKPKGEVSLADMVVGQTTGTFTVRAKFANPERILIPGMFVSASIELGTLANAFLVPQRAVTRGDDGKATVFIVSADEKAVRTEIDTDGTSGNDWIVTAGIKAGDRLIVDGFQSLSDGLAVTPVLATIDSDGVVEQKLATETAPEAGK